MSKTHNLDNTPNHTSHLFNRDELADVVNRVCRKIEKIGGVEAVAVCGFSGIIPGVMVAHLLGINLIAIRKSTEVAQADSRVCNVEYGSPKFKRWVILDDLIATGFTIDWMVDSVREERVVNVKRPLAILLHTDRGEMGAQMYVSGCARRVPIYRV